MSKPDWCAQEAKRVYHSLENSHVFNEIAIARALMEAHQRGRREGMEEADKAADWLDEAATEVEDWGAYAGAYFQEKYDLEGCVQEIRERASFIRAKAQEAAKERE